MQKHVHLVDLAKIFPTHIFLQNLASIQKRTSPIKFTDLVEKSEWGSISNLSTKVFAGGSSARALQVGHRPMSTSRCWKCSAGSPATRARRTSSSSTAGSTLPLTMPTRTTGASRVAQQIRFHTPGLWRRRFLPELKGSIGEGSNHSNHPNHSNHANSFKIRKFSLEN